jgi:dihydropteroate synthase
MSSKNTSFHKRKMYCGSLVLDFSSPLVMGILNLTPDSFFKGSRFQNEKDTMEAVEKMLKDGADVIDVGAVSTRPGADNIDVEEEKKRIVQMLQSLVKAFPETIFSIDTYRAEIARACIGTGAHIINDISGGQFDDKMFATVADLRVPYILMHLKGRPKEMQTNPVSHAVSEEIRNYFREKIKQLKEVGVKDIILDPGFGFGKTLECNYSLLKHFEALRIDGLPLLAGLSRKSMINKVLGTEAVDALNGTTVLHTIALLNGANILRVHDVKEAVEAVRMARYYQGFEECD